MQPVCTGDVKSGASIAIANDRRVRHHWPRRRRREQMGKADFARPGDQRGVVTLPEGGIWVHPTASAPLPAAALALALLPAGFGDGRRRAPFALGRFVEFDFIEREKIAQLLIETE